MRKLQSLAGLFAFKNANESHESHPTELMPIVQFARSLRGVKGGKLPSGTQISDCLEIMCTYLCEKERERIRLFLANKESRSGSEKRA